LLPRKTHGLRGLSPIVVAASDYGAASLSNLRICWFTLVVVGLLSYARLDTGSILNPSADVLWPGPPPRWRLPPPQGRRELQGAAVSRVFHEHGSAARATKRGQT
jgi:hypothetical protein